jgi:hypothetical protein
MPPKGRKPLGWFTRGRMGGVDGAGLEEGRLELLPKEDDGLLLQLLEEWELGPREEDEE